MILIITLCILLTIILVDKKMRSKLTNLFTKDKDDTNPTTEPITTTESTMTTEPVVTTEPIVKTKPSNNQQCEVTDWSDWGMCLPSKCGQQGIQKRTRQIRINGENCPELEQKKPCQNAKCQCKVSEWKYEDNCKGPCGGKGVMKRRRTILNANLETNDEKLANCPHLEESIECDTIPCPYQCTLQDWENVGDCVGKCGITEGMQNQIRRIKVPGKPITNCPSESSEQRKRKIFCKTKECPPPTCQYETLWKDITSCPPCGFGNFKTVRKNLLPGTNNNECIKWIEKQEQCQNTLCKENEIASNMYILDSNQIPNYLKYYPNFNGHKFHFKRSDDSFTKPSIIIKHNMNGNFLKIQPSPGLDVTTYTLAFSSYKKMLIGSLDDSMNDAKSWHYLQSGNHNGNIGYKMYVKINGLNYYLKTADNPHSAGASNDIISSRGENFTADVNIGTVFYFTKPLKIDCSGVWSSCTNGIQTYTLTQQAYTGGIANCNRTGDTRPCEKEIAYLKPGTYKLIFPHYENDTDMANDKISKLGSKMWDSKSMYTWHWATHVHEINVTNSFEFKMQLYGQVSPMTIKWDDQGKQYKSNLVYHFKKIMNGEGGKYGGVARRWFFKSTGRNATIAMIIPIEEYKDYVNKQPNKDKIAF